MNCFWQFSACPFCRALVVLLRLLKERAQFRDLRDGANSLNILVIERTDRLIDVPAFLVFLCKPCESSARISPSKEEPFLETPH